IPLQQLNGLETLVIIMVANKYAFLQITRRRFLNEWEAFKKVISRSEERFSRNAETDLVCRLLLEKKNPQEIVQVLHMFAMCIFFIALSHTLVVICLSFLFSDYVHLLDLHSFPTRRSSDLIPLQQLNGLETLVIIMVANKYAFLQITRRRFLNEWEAFKKVIS